MRDCSLLYPLTVGGIFRHTLYDQAFNLVFFCFLFFVFCIIRQGNQISMMSNSTYADVVSGSKTKVSLMIWHLNCDLWSTVLRLEIEGVRIIKNSV